MFLGNTQNNEKAILTRMDTDPPRMNTDNAPARDCLIFRWFPSSGLGTYTAKLQLGVSRTVWKLELPESRSQAGAWERA
jgi:hypothetical protein